jgi:hypothetical protein
LEGLTVGPIAQIEPDVENAGRRRAVERRADELTAAQPADPLGPLSDLPGTWKGQGFSAIWRPHVGGQDRFLELNLTTETLVFSSINGAIPNWGLLNPDIDMVGVSCMHQVAEASSGAGLHIEPGVLAHVPPMTDPGKPPTVVRMTSIPARTVILAQGSAQRLNGGSPHIPDNNIIPCPIGDRQRADSRFLPRGREFPELDLSTPTAFRYSWPGVTQAMVDNPNSVLQAAVHAQPVSGRTVLRVSSPATWSSSDGSARTGFLTTRSGARSGQGSEMEVDATFWIESLPGSDGRPGTLQLQYSQAVQLDFNGQRWPHVRVATLRKLPC